MKYYLKCTDTNGSTVELNFEAVSLLEIVPELDRFLRAVGFYYDGGLEIVEHWDQDKTPD